MGFPAALLAVLPQIMQQAREDRESAATGAYQLFNQKAGDNIAIASRPKKPVEALFQTPAQGEE